MIEKRFVYPNDHSFRIRSRGRLPHWELDNGLYFVTWRLHDSLPAEAFERLNQIRAIFLNACGESMTAAVRTELERAIFRETESWLDKHMGECHLRDPRIAELVHEALEFFEGNRHRMICWTIMPNHVHTVFVLFRGSDLGPLLHSWKRHTALQSNRYLGRRGRFWEKEYFDRLIRSPEEFRNTIRYVLDNPSKAGLEDWPWTWCRDDLDIR